MIWVDGVADEEATVNVPLGPDPDGVGGVRVTEEEASGRMHMLLPVQVAAGYANHVVRVWECGCVWVCGDGEERKTERRGDSWVRDVGCSQGVGAGGGEECEWTGRREFDARKRLATVE